MFPENDSVIYGLSVSANHLVFGGSRNTKENKGGSTAKVEQGGGAA